MRLLRGPRELTIDAPAKLNLVLAVGPRRDDGYHELASAMQAIDLCDTLTVRVDDARPGAASVAVDAPGLEGGDTLVTRALELVLDDVRRDDVAVEVALDKRIPAGAGLGGGSSDAAAAMLALDALLDAGLGRDRLAALAAEVGSDLPFFFATSGSAIVRGRGEAVEEVDAFPPRTWIVAWPGVSSSTAEVYCRFDELGGGRSELPDDAQLLALVQQGDPVNDLAAAAVAACPSLAHLVDAVRDIVERPLVAGSGSAVAVACDTHARDDEVEARLRAAGATFIARCASRGGATAGR